MMKYIHYLMNLGAQLRNQLETLISYDEPVELAEIEYGGIPELKASSGIFSQISKWFKRFLTDKASNFLINASAAEMKDTIEMINCVGPERYEWYFYTKSHVSRWGHRFC